MRIPLFPLNLVMYPGAVYPLYIFEPRYIKMVNDCLNNSKPFGIVAKIDSEIFDVGCLVETTSVQKYYENGSMDILVKGTKRFRTIRTRPTSAGYIEAEVKTYDDNEHYLFDENWIKLIIDKFKHLIGRTHLNLDEKYWRNLQIARNKAYKIAEKSGLNLKQQQKLLTLQSENERMELIEDHLEKLEQYLDKTEMIQELIARDGYLND